MFYLFLGEINVRIHFFILFKLHFTILAMKTCAGEKLKPQAQGFLNLSLIPSFPSHAVCLLYVIHSHEFLGYLSCASLCKNKQAYTDIHLFFYLFKKSTFRHFFFFFAVCFKTYLEITLRQFAETFLVLFQSV